MKKSILALSIVLASGSAFADIEVYESDNVLVKFGGAVNVKYKRDYAGSADEKKQSVLDVGDGNLAVNLEAKINDDLTGLAFYELKRNEHDADAWVGLKGDFGTFKAGKLCTPWDAKGSQKDKDYSKKDISGTIGWSEGCNKQAVSYEVSLGNFYTGLGYQQAPDTDATKDFSQIDAKAGVKFGDLDVMAIIVKGDKGDIERTGYTIEAHYNMGNVGLSGGMIQENAENDDLKEGYRTYQVSASYAMGDTTLAGGYDIVNGLESLDGTDSKTIYVNLTHKLAANAEVYTEVGRNDMGAYDSVAYQAGMKIFF